MVMNMYNRVHREKLRRFIIVMSMYLLHEHNIALAQSVCVYIYIYSRFKNRCTVQSDRETDTKKRETQTYRETERDT